MTSAVTFDVADPTSDDARYCIDAYFDELTEPEGVLLLARLDGDPVGCGALKLHDDAPADPSPEE